MSKSKYLAGIYNELYEYFTINDGFTVGQKLAQIEKTAEKRFIEITDEELFNTIQKLEKTDYHSDEKTTEEEFNKWTEKWSK